MRLSIAIVAAATIVAFAADPIWWQTNGMGAAWSARDSVDTNSRPHRLVALPPYVAVTNDAGRVLTLKRPLPTRTARLHSHGRTYEVDHWGNVRDLTPTNGPATPDRLAARLRRARENRARLDRIVAELEAALAAATNLTEVAQ